MNNPLHSEIADMLDKELHEMLRVGRQATGPFGELLFKKETGDPIYRRPNAAELGQIMKRLAQITAGQIAGAGPKSSSEALQRAAQAKLDAGELKFNGAKIPPLSLEPDTRRRGNA